MFVLLKTMNCVIHEALLSKRKLRMSYINVQHSELNNEMASCCSMVAMTYIQHNQMPKLYCMKLNKSEKPTLS